MTENEKPGIEELYAAAIARGVPDRLILAAGLQRERVGVMLLRLRAEYDTVRGDLERAGQIAPGGARRALELRQRAEKARRLGDEGMAAELLAEADSIQRRAPAEVMSARAVILVALASLQDARQELGALAVRMGANPKRALAPAVVLRLAGRVLDVWLDETCHRCDGTGILGSRYQGDAERQCPTCKGTGHRRDILGDSLQQTRFAGDLLAEVQRQVGAAAAGIKAAIHADSGPAAEIHPELRRRLAELRGVEASAD